MQGKQKSATPTAVRPLLSGRPKSVFLHSTRSERDPHGIEQHAPGAKLDHGKPRPELAVRSFAKALRLVAEHQERSVREASLLDCLVEEDTRTEGATALTAALILRTIAGERQSPPRTLGPPGLPYPDALWEVAKVAIYGAKKYTVDGWRQVPDGVQHHTDAMYRHILRHEEGEVLDPESGFTHLAHAAWNALARTEFLCRAQDAQTENR